MNEEAKSAGEGRTVGRTQETNAGLNGDSGKGCIKSTGSSFAIQSHLSGALPLDLWKDNVTYVVLSCACV